MTRASLREYAAVQRERYLQATRAEKRQLLDEVVAVTGIHRKAAIRLLRRAAAPARRRRARAGRPRALRPGGRRGRRGPVAGQRPDRRPSAAPLRARAARPPPPVRRTTLAPAVDKLAAPGQPPHPRPPARRPPAPSTRGAGPPRTRPGHLAQARDPDPHLRRVDRRPPGFCEVDLVAHCGRSTEGFYLCTLCAVDIATAWVELEAVWGKGQKRVGGAIHHVRQRLPMPLVGLDSDNGSEFINRALLRLVPRARHHLHPQPPLEEERQCPCRAEERRRRPPARRL